MGERIVLRAELFHESRRIVGHTTDVGRDSVFVRTEERIQLGAHVLLRLSFPRLLAPLELAATVASREGGSGHGYFAGFVLEFDPNERLGMLERKPGDAGSAGACRILVVEDSAIMRDIVDASASAFSETFKLDVVSTDSAEAAIELIEREPVDLAVVDQYLPGRLTGADFVRDLRARKIDLPVIGFSVGGTKARLAFLDAGADIFLDKPIGLKEIFATLERLSSLAARDVGLKRILLMDDSEIFLDVAGAALEAAGYAVIPARDLADLERVRNQGRCDLVLMDVQMPEAFGDDVALTLRDSYGIGAPIYLLSSLTDGDLADRVEWAQVDGFISKNRGLEAIVEDVVRILGPAATSA